jgi:AcrR family transcriptional regulator
VLVEDGAEHLTTGRICRVAGVPSSALYQYFSDRQDILEALGDRYLDQFRTANAHLLAQARTEPWDDVVGRLLEAYLELYRSLPGFRALWLAHFDAALASRYDAHLDAMGEGLLSILVAQHSIEEPARARTACHVAMRTGDALLRWAFADDPSGDLAVLIETDRLMRLYLHDVIGRKADG